MLINFFKSKKLCLVKVKPQRKHKSHNIIIKVKTLIKKIFCGVVSLWIIRVRETHNTKRINSIVSLTQKNPQMLLPAPHKPPSDKAIVKKVRIKRLRKK